MARITRSPALATACLAVSAALAIHTVRQARAIHDLRTPPAVPALADATEAAARTRELAGTYATGTLPGDRVLTVRSEGVVEFTGVGRAGGAAAPFTAPFTLGRQGKTLYLVLREGEPIEVVNLGTLVYGRDTYRRR